MYNVYYFFLYILLAPELIPKQGRQLFSTSCPEVVGQALRAIPYYIYRSV